MKRKMDAIFGAGSYLRAGIKHQGRGTTQLSTARVCPLGQDELKAEGKGEQSTAYAEMETKDVKNRGLRLDGKNKFV